MQSTTQGGDLILFALMMSKSPDGSQNPLVAFLPLILFVVIIYFLYRGFMRKRAKSTDTTTKHIEPGSVKKENSQTSSLQIKPRTFGQVFGQAAPLLGGAFFGLLYLLNIDHVRYSDKQTEQLLVSSLFFGIVMGLVAAYFYKGEVVIKECDNPKKAFATLAVRLAENGYNLETQTESLHTFKPPLNRWIGGRVYIISEGLTLRIVGPTYVLKKLRNV